MADLRHTVGAQDGDEGAEASELPPSALDPSAAAIAMQTIAGDPEVRAKVAAYFHQQTRLVATQMEHLHEQRAVQLSLLQVKRVSEWLHVASQLFLVTASLFVGSYVIVMVRDALTSRAVVVEPFEVPPQMAAAGITGAAVGGEFLDELTKLQAAARSSSSGRPLASSKAEDIKLEIPETGISIGEIDRLLKARLSSDTRISGDLMSGPDGTIDLALRGNGITPRSFSGPAGQWRELLVKAAEYAYGETQPGLYAAYLARAGRYAEAIEFSKKAVGTAGRQDLPLLYNTWATTLANTGGAARTSLELEKLAIAAQPDYWVAYANAMSDAHNLGDDEQAWKIGDSMLKRAGGRPGRAPEADFQTLDYLTWNLLPWRAGIIEDARAHAGLGSSFTAEDPEIAGIDADLHDWDAARLLLDVIDRNDPYAAAMRHYVLARMAEDRGDADTARREFELYGAANADPTISGGDISYHCLVAEAETAAGRDAQALSELAAGGNYTDCYRFRGDLLDRQGDWAGAQRAYAKAVAIAPHLPAGYYSWGLALARHGALAGAERMLQRAIEYGPGWAEPRKALGDLYARQQRWGKAARQYRAALARAPAWTAAQAALDRTTR